MQINRDTQVGIPAERGVIFFLVRGGLVGRVDIF